jgi:hypothetical protein
MRRMAFSCLSLSSLHEAVVVCSSYAVRRIRYCIMALVVLGWMLNRYCAYLANKVVLT